jgi:hypothetical protein
MSEKNELVTVATMQSPGEAALIKNLLESVGIQAFLADENSVAMAWHLTGALGGVKVLVAAADAEAAADYLERKPWQTEEDESATAIAEPGTLQQLPPQTSDEEEEPEERLSAREKNANRALMASICGLIVLPLQLYALYLLCQVWSSPDRLQGKPRRNVKLSALITLTIVLLPVLVIVVAVALPPKDEVDLRAFPHPEILIGKWAGTFRDKDGESAIEMDLKRDGKLRYKQTGAVELDSTGTWGYTNHTLYVRLERFTKGDSPVKGQIAGWEMDRCDEKEMVLREPEGKLRLTRQ